MSKLPSPHTIRLFDELAVIVQAYRDFEPDPTVPLLDFIAANRGRLTAKMREHNARMPASILSKRPREEDFEGPKKRQKYEEARDKFEQQAHARIEFSHQVHGLGAELKHLSVSVREAVDSRRHGTAPEGPCSECVD